MIIGAIKRLYRKPRLRKPRMVTPIGKITKVVWEGDNLVIEGKLNLETKDGREIYNLMKEENRGRSDNAR